MAMNNAERQAKYRAAGKEARAGLEDAFGPLSALDVTILTRIFGPRLAVEGADVAAFAAEATEVAMAVDWRGPIAIYDAEPCISALLANVVHKGIGGGIVMGWSLRTEGELTTLAVHRVKPAERIAA